MKISTQHKTEKSSIFGKIGIFSASLLAATSAVYIYSPVIGTHADSSAESDINLTVGDALSLTLDKTALDLSATINTFVSGTINAVVTSNSQYGYTLTLEDKDNNTSMVHTNENVSSVVTSNFDGEKTSATMDNNTWGFSLDSTNFSKIPVNGSPVTLKRTNTVMTAASETTAVDFGAKVGMLTSGVYTDKVVFTAYVNGQDDSGNDDMQSFSCDTMAVGETTTLTDSRDNNTYGVAKLADGNCWMTENLRLVGPRTLTSADSTVTADFDLPASSTIAEWTYERVNQTDNLYNVPMLHQSDNSSYGVYYNWYTATAGTGDATLMDSLTASSSVCPKGWRLPSAMDWYTFGYSYSGQAGILDGLVASAEPISMVYGGAIYAPATYNSWKAYLGNAGHVGYLWSASKDGGSPITMDNYGTQHYTGYDDNTAITISHTYRGDGYAIRCVAN
jgi:uncharacterized protein (TIGR02145 family)